MNHPFGAGAALHRSTLPGYISSAYGTGKDRAKVRINIAAHQEKKKNEKTSKRRAGEERRQSTDFKEVVCCPFAVVQSTAKK